MPKCASNDKQRNKKSKIKQKKQSKMINQNRKIKKKKTISKRRRVEPLTKTIKIQKKNKITSLLNKNQYISQGARVQLQQSLTTTHQQRIILFIPFNASVELQPIAKYFYDYFSQTPNYNLTMFPQQDSKIDFSINPVGNTPIKSKMRFIFRRDNYIEAFKYTDFLIPILSCKHADPQHIALHPFQSGFAFDEDGYSLLSNLRSLGLPSTLSIVQHLDQHPKRDQDKVMRYFKMFLNDEFGEKVISSEDQIIKTLLVLNSKELKKQPWKNNRGYMLIDNVMVVDGRVQISGELKGDCVHANQLIQFPNHHEAYDIYSIQAANRKNASVQYSTISEEKNRFAKPSANTQDILNAIQGIDGLHLEEEIGDQKMGSDIEEGSEEEISYEQEEYEEEGKNEERRKRQGEIAMREEDQLQFQDQVQYKVEESLREKYKEYQGLSNFKKTQWNHLENLPTQYDRIFLFKNYDQTYRKTLAQQQSMGFAYPGHYITITLNTATLPSIPQSCYFLLKHQRKMTQLHLKLSSNYFQDIMQQPLQSNTPYELSLGFRVQTIVPIFSKVISGSNKTKYTKRIQQEGLYFCSFYAVNYFPPAPALLYKAGRAVMVGTLVKCDPMHIVLQRILLTGYPHKINRRKATVRYLFFNAKDAKYYKPIELRSKMGLRGRIEDSLGTHGVVKCLFSDKIKHNDTVYMALYKRMYPVWQYQDQDM